MDSEQNEGSEGPRRSLRAPQPKKIEDIGESPKVAKRRGRKPGEPVAKRQKKATEAVVQWICCEKCSKWRIVSEAMFKILSKKEAPSCSEIAPDLSCELEDDEVRFASPDLVDSRLGVLLAATASAVSKPQAKVTPAIPPAGVAGAAGGAVSVQRASISALPASGAPSGVPGLTRPSVTSATPLISPPAPIPAFAAAATVPGTGTRPSVIPPVTAGVTAARPAGSIVPGVPVQPATSWTAGVPGLPGAGSSPRNYPAMPAQPNISAATGLGFTLPTQKPASPVAAGHPKLGFNLPAQTGGASPTMKPHTFAVGMPTAAPVSGNLSPAKPAVSATSAVSAAYVPSGLGFSVPSAHAVSVSPVKPSAPISPVKPSAPVFPVKPSTPVSPVKPPASMSPVKPAAAFPAGPSPVKPVGFPLPVAGVSPPKPAGAAPTSPTAKPAATASPVKPQVTLWGGAGVASPVKPAAPAGGPTVPAEYRPVSPVNKPLGFSFGAMPTGGMPSWGASAAKPAAPPAPVQQQQSSLGFNLPKPGQSGSGSPSNSKPSHQ